MHSKAPGDDREMVAARAAFLERGYYAPLRQALEELVLEASAHLEGPVLLDSGCGEGYYTAGMFRALERAGHRPRAAGIDISKYALRRAAKRLPEGEFAVASAYRLPLADASADLLTNVFSPLSAEEFARVLRPGRHLPLCGPLRPAPLGDEAGPLFPALRKPRQGNPLYRLFLSAHRPGAV